MNKNMNTIRKEFLKIRYTVKSFQMKKIERSDDSKFHPCIDFWRLLQERITQRHLSPNFLKNTFRVSSLPEKKFYHHIFFSRKKSFFQVLDSMLRFLKRCSGICFQTVIYTNQPQFYVFFFFFFNYSEVTKLYFRK